MYCSIYTNVYYISLLRKVKESLNDLFGIRNISGISNGVADDTFYFAMMKNGHT